MKTAVKQYIGRFTAAMAAYVVVLVTVTLVINRMGNTPWRYPLALLPVVPLIFAVSAYMNYLSKIDELAQRIQLQALAFSFGITALLTFAYGLLDSFGLPAISWIWILPVMIFLWGIGTAIASWRYR